MNDRKKALKNIFKNWLTKKPVLIENTKPKKKYKPHEELIGTVTPHIDWFSVIATISSDNGFFSIARKELHVYIFTHTDFLYNSWETSKPKIPMNVWVDNLFENEDWDKVGCYRKEYVSFRTHQSNEYWSHVVMDYGDNEYFLYDHQKYFNRTGMTAEQVHARVVRGLNRPLLPFEGDEAEMPKVNMNDHVRNASDDEGEEIEF